MKKNKANFFTKLKKKIKYFN